MTDEKTKWTEIDNYFSKIVKADSVLEQALADSEAAELIPHHVAENQGKLLQILAQIQGAKRILEIGTLGGYSTIWLARALPKDGCLISLEFSPIHAQVAKNNIARAGLEDIVCIYLGRALDSLEQMEKNACEPFDFIFIDADKQSSLEYIKWALKFSRVGTVIVADNVVRNGDILDETSTSPSVDALRKFFDYVAAEPRLSATALQTVGSKGHDGIVLARVVG